ncbi:MAG: hypothetical protein IPP06_12185 [Saprospiraceae bacterium]|nr:hypothetical protein [Candidatus Vicinibacter affinis]
MNSINRNKLNDFHCNWLKFAGFPILRTEQAVQSHFNQWDRLEKLTTKTVNFPKSCV